MFMHARPNGRAADGTLGCGRDEGISIRTAVSSNEGPVMGMLNRCSSLSLFHRFHGRVDAVNHFKRQWDKPAVAILLAWHGDMCVGISELASDADFAILVEDHWQGRGVGSRLLEAVVGEAAARRHDVIHADVLVEDAFLLRVLCRMGPLTVIRDMGVLSVDIRIELSLRSHHVGNHRRHARGCHRVNRHAACHRRDAQNDRAATRRDPLGARTGREEAWHLLSQIEGLPSLPRRSIGSPRRCAIRGGLRTSESRDRC